MSDVPPKPPAIPDSVRSALKVAIPALAVLLVALAAWLLPSDGGEGPPPTTGTTVGTTTTEAPTTGTSATSSTSATATTSPPTSTTTTVPQGEPERVNGTLTRAGWPTDATTGPSLAGFDEGHMRPCSPASGSWTITQPGSWGGCRFRGIIRVNVPNNGEVRLHDMVIEGNTGGSPVITRQAGRLTVERSIIGPGPGPYTNVGDQGQACGSAIAFEYELRDSEVYGCADGAKGHGAVTITGTFFHDLRRTCAPAGCTHNDAFQQNDNNRMTRLTFTGNSVYLASCTSNRAFQLKNMSGAQVTIAGNFFSGEHGVVNIDGTAAGNEGAITGNTLAGSNRVGPFTAQDDGTASFVPLFSGNWSSGRLAGLSTAGNVFESGDEVPAGGRPGPYRCDPLPNGWEG